MIYGTFVLQIKTWWYNKQQSVLKRETIVLHKMCQLGKKQLILSQTNEKAQIFIIESVIEK